MAIQFLQAALKAVYLMEPAKDIFACVLNAFKQNKGTKIGI
jgi:hypothetical protein